MTFDYFGKVVSNNDAKKMHWRTLKKKVDVQKLEFKSIIRAKGKFFFEKFRVYLSYNTRHDADNLGATLKTFLDQLKINGNIVDDAPKYCKGVCIEHDGTLPKKCLRFEIEEV